MKHRVRFMPDDVAVEVRPGMTLLEASRRAGARVRTRCGGVAGCLMCKVRIEPADAGSLRAPTNAEIIKLGETMLGDGMRLACQARVEGDVLVHLPEDPLKAAIRKQLAEQRDDDWLN